MSYTGYPENRVRLVLLTPEQNRQACDTADGRIAEGEQRGGNHVFVPEGKRAQDWEVYGAKGEIAALKAYPALVPTTKGVESDLSKFIRSQDSTFEGLKFEVKTHHLINHQQLPFMINCLQWETKTRYADYVIFCTLVCPRDRIRDERLVGVWGFYDPKKAPVNHKVYEGKDGQSRSWLIPRHEVETPFIFPPRSRWIR